MLLLRWIWSGHADDIAPVVVFRTLRVLFFLMTQRTGCHSGRDEEQEQELLRKEARQVPAGEEHARLILGIKPGQAILRRRDGET